MKKSRPPHQQSSPSRGQFITLFGVLSVLEYALRLPVLLTFVALLYRLFMEAA
ncbi:hypothetical protein OH720_28335 [Pseudomonas sp. WJP1]|uniref:hypothetical protein n=1 Tax=Pseudomonas sp. WJP1 TaxID=2986947 RepID=UPI00234B835E|nr:hypothetical protein [Pseudomonas sp. WJP1]WCM50807.1 hypothetical protein OH720_28335 [Pseudomonas sp. WJP1]